MIAGLDRPNAGTVTVAGQRLDSLGETALAKYRRRGIGMIFQFFNLITHSQDLATRYASRTGRLSAVRAIATGQAPSGHRFYAAHRRRRGRGHRRSRRALTGGGSSC